MRYKQYGRIQIFHDLSKYGRPECFLSDPVGRTAIAFALGHPARSEFCWLSVIC
jgi:hypothetical protein